MTEPATQVTIATSSGAVWLSLIIHFSAGLLGLSSGVVAIASAKGGPLHRRSGTLFVIAMIALGVVGAGIATYERKYGSVIGGTFTAYLVFTAFTTVRSIAGRHGRAVGAALMVFAFLLALGLLAVGVVAFNSPHRALNGVPAFMILFLGTVALLAAAGDWRLLRAGTISGVRRLTRHLWRMCFGLFIASGSFFFGQMKFLPEPLRILPVLGALGVFPLFVLLYWLWRVRLRKRLQGMILRDPVETPAILARAD